jgi:integrase
LIDDQQSATILLKDWLSRWLDEKVRRDRKLNTQERYEIIIRRQIVPYLGDLELSALTPRAIESMQSDLLRSGLASSTVRNAHTILSSAYKEAVRLGFTDHNPVASVAPPVRRQRRIIPPPVAVVQHLLRLTREEGHYLYPFLHLLVYTGMRRGEALALRWGNVNLDQGYLTVVEAAVKTRTMGLMLTEPKSHHSHRTIDLDDGTADVLREHRAKKVQTGQAVDDLGALVFPGRAGRLMPVTPLQRQLKRLGERVGDETVTFHSLRHFYATVALQQRQNVVVVSNRLGHSSVSMTLDIYGHTIPGWQRSMAEAFAQAMRDDMPETRS